MDEGVDKVEDPRRDRHVVYTSPHAEHITGFMVGLENGARPSVSTPSLKPVPTLDEPRSTTSDDNGGTASDPSNTKKVADATGSSITTSALATASSWSLNVQQKALAF